MISTEKLQECIDYCVGQGDRRISFPMNEIRPIFEELIKLRKVTAAARAVSALLQSEDSEGYVDTHTAADLAEALIELEGE